VRIAKGNRKLAELEAQDVAEEKMEG